VWTVFAWSAQFAEAVEFDSDSEFGLVAFPLFLLSLPWKLVRDRHSS
jgi:hypothetical protein